MWKHFAELEKKLLGSQEKAFTELDEKFIRSQEELAQHKATCEQQLASLQRRAEKSQEALLREAERATLVQQAWAAAEACQKTVEDQGGKLLTLQEELHSLKIKCETSEENQWRLEQSQRRAQELQASTTSALDKFRQENIEVCHESAQEVRAQLQKEVEAKLQPFRQVTEELSSLVRTQAGQDQSLVELRAAQARTAAAVQDLQKTTTQQNQHNLSFRQSFVEIKAEQVRCLQSLRDEQARRASALQESISQQTADFH